MRESDSWSWKPCNPEFEAADDSTVAVETNYQPGKRARVVLSFVRSVLQALRESSLDYFFVAHEDLPDEALVNVRMGNGATSDLTLGRARLLFRDVCAVIWKPAPWMIFTDAKAPSTTAAYAKTLHFRRWSQLLRDLPALVPRDTIWLPSHPLNGSQEWQNRLAELLIARDEGFRVPNTLCTNDPDEAIAFIRKAGGRVLHRDWSVQPFLSEIAWLTIESVNKKRAQFALTPNVLMQYVPKTFEVRAVVVGDRVFAVRIDSQASPSKSAREDWRQYDFKNVKWERMRLPRLLEARMLRLMKRLDLRWGSFDLICGTDGEFYFLEVNRPGSFASLEPLVGLDIAHEITSYLERALAKKKRTSRRRSPNA